MSDADHLRKAIALALAESLRGALDVDRLTLRVVVMDDTQVEVNLTALVDAVVRGMVEGSRTSELTPDEMRTASDALKAAGEHELARKVDRVRLRR